MANEAQRDKTERLLNLIIALISTRVPMTKEQIRRQIPQYGGVEGFDRMFERDKDELREIGVPVATAPLDVLHDDLLGYRIDRSEYRLPEMHFEADELAALALAGRAWSQASLTGPALAGLHKLARSGVDVDDGPLAGIAPRVRADDPSFEPLRKARRARQQVSFSYRKTGGETTTRRVQPWGLVNWQGRWYLTGFDIDRGAERVFRLGRIEGRVTVSGRSGAYEVPADHRPRVLVAEERAGAQRSTARLRLAPGAGQLLRRRASSLVDDTEGWVVVEIEYAEPARLVDEVVSLGRQVLVEGPDQLVSAVCDRLSGALSAHDAVINGTLPARATSDHGSRPRRSSLPPVESAPRRLSRLLAMVPWLLDHQGVPLETAAREFDVTAEQLVADLELLFVCGTPGHMPDDLIEADWEDGHIYLGNADAIAEPLHLTVDEAVALMVGLRTLAQAPGAGEAVGRALAKLESAAGHLGDTGAVLVDLPPGEHLDELQDAVRRRRRVHLAYYVPGRDEVTERDVDPMRLLNLDAKWYLEGWCHLASATRLFRLDRIHALSVLDVDGTPPARAQQRELDVAYVPQHDDVTVTMETTDSGAWIADYYVVESMERRDEGGVRLALRTADTEWVRRLALRAGGSMWVTAPRELATWVHDEATATLAQYRRSRR